MVYLNDLDFDLDRNKTPTMHPYNATRNISTKFKFALLTYATLSFELSVFQPRIIAFHLTRNTLHKNSYYKHQTQTSCS